MREIKFRGYNKNRALVYGNLAVFNGGPHIQINDIDFVEVLPETVGEFTGLKDKNGQDIYEGDVVNAILNKYVIENEGLYSHNNNVISKVHYVGGCFVIDVWIGGSAPLHLPFLSYPTINNEVIGNIYENPELIDES